TLVSYTGASCLPSIVRRAVREARCRFCRRSWAGSRNLVRKEDKLGREYSWSFTPSGFPTYRASSGQEALRARLVRSFWRQAIEPPILTAPGDGGVSCHLLKIRSFGTDRATWRSSPPGCGANLHTSEGD